MYALIEACSMNAKNLIITLASYNLWLICNIIVIMIAIEGSTQNQHVAPLITVYITLIFYTLFVLARLFQQWRTRTVVMADNNIFIVGSLLFCGTGFTFSRILIVPPAFQLMYQGQFFGAFGIATALLALIVIVSHQLKKTTGTALPSKEIQKMLLLTILVYFAWILLDTYLVVEVVSYMNITDDTVPVVLIQDGIIVFYGLTLFLFSRKQRRSRPQEAHENKLFFIGGILYVITPIIMLLTASFIGYDLVWSTFFTITQLSFVVFGVMLTGSIAYMNKKIKNEPSAMPQAVEAQPAERMPQHKEEQRRQVEEKARKQAEVAAQRKADAEAKQRQKAEAEAKQKAKNAARAKADEEKAKRKAEEEARKRAEADEKLRRKAEQDAQKKAEYEAEMRRRAEAEAKAKAEADAKRRAEEDAKMKKLQQLVKVSDRLSVARMAQLLEMPAEEVWKHVPDWAEKFNFRIAGEELVFNKENLDAFMASLDAEFRKWGKDGKV